MNNNYVMLNNIEHQNTRVITRYGADFGDNVNFVMTFPPEFRNVQGHYPIFFRKDSDTGTFFPIALFGFEAGENLFLNGEDWDAHYVPLMIRRHPFIIGFQRTEDGGEEPQAVVSIDMNSPRVNESEGEELFLPHGGTSDYLVAVTDMLEKIQLGSEMNKEFIELLLKYDLIEPVDLKIEMDDRSKHHLLGLYTIHEENLYNLDEEALASLHSRQFLQPVYMMLASLSRFRTLVEKKNERAAQS